MTLASRLRQLRTANRLSLQEVANAVDISKAHVFNLEKGLTRNPSMDLVGKLADLYRVRVSDLVGENPDAEDQPAEIVAMFRDFRDLDDQDRDMIGMMIETMKKKRREKRD